MNKAFKDIKLQNEAKEIVSSKAFELLVEGPARSGKNFAVLMKIHYLLSTYPNSRALLIRKTKNA